jgi:hypothetical protein
MMLDLAKKGGLIRKINSDATARETFNRGVQESNAKRKSKDTQTGVQRLDGGRRVDEATPEAQIPVPETVVEVKPQEIEVVTEPAPVAEAPIVEDVKMPKNKKERKEAAIKGDVVYHRFFETIIESTREQYNNALKEVAETGAIENALNYGKAVSERQVPNNEEIQYGPTLLDMNKEDADYYLKERTKAEPAPVVEAPVVQSKIYYQGIPKGSNYMQAIIDENGETLFQGSLEGVEKFKKDNGEFSIKRYF